jgi:hypothetical protein
MGKPEGKRPFGRPKRRWENNIKTDLQDMGCGGYELNQAGSNRDRRRVFVNAVMNLRIFYFKLSPCSVCCMFSSG